MQNKLDKLTILIDGLKPKQKTYALNLLADLVTIINNQEKEIESLIAYKINNKLSEYECEIQKYVLLLIYYGFSQKFIKVIRQECVLFITKNRKHIPNLSPSEIKLIDLFLMSYELENDKEPESYLQLKKFMDESKD